MMERCSNCLGCKWIPFDKIKSQRFGENCPSVCYYNFQHIFRSAGRFQLGTDPILDGDADYSEKITEVVHSCTSMRCMRRKLQDLPLQPGTAGTTTWL